MAGELIHRVETIRPRVISVARGFRMIEMSRKRLLETTATLLDHVPGSRSADGSEQNLEATVRSMDPHGHCRRYNRGPSLV